MSIQTFPAIFGCSHLITDISEPLTHSLSTLWAICPPQTHAEPFPDSPDVVSFGWEKRLCSRFPWHDISQPGGGAATHMGDDGDACNSGCQIKGRHELEMTWVCAESMGVCEQNIILCRFFFLCFTSDSMYTFHLSSFKLTFPFESAVSPNSSRGQSDPTKGQVAAGFFSNRSTPHLTEVISLADLSNSTPDWNPVIKWSDTSDSWLVNLSLVGTKKCTHLALLEVSLTSVT